MSTFKSTPDRDGDFVDFTSNVSPSLPHIAILGAGDHEDNYSAACLTRDDAATLASHLAAAVEAADARAAAAARKLKRGDLVQLHGDPEARRVVITDEDESGRVDLVNLDEVTLGQVQERRHAAQYERVTA